MSWNLSHWGHVNVSINLMSVDGESVLIFTIPSSRGRTKPVKSNLTADQYNEVSLCETTFLPSSRCSHCNVSGHWITNITRQGNAHYFDSVTPRRRSWNISSSSSSSAPSSLTRGLYNKAISRTTTVKCQILSYCTSTGITQKAMDFFCEILKTHKL